MTEGAQEYKHPRWFKRLILIYILFTVAWIVLVMATAVTQNETLAKIIEPIGMPILFFSFIGVPVLAFVHLGLKADTRAKKILFFLIAAAVFAYIAGGILYNILK